MTFEKFSICIKEYLEGIYPNEEVVINRVTKNNGVIYSGVTISGENRKVSPTIYLETFYDMYLKGDSLDDVKKRVRDIYSSRKIDYDVDFGFFNDFEKVKDKLKCRLINVSSNEKYLENVPYERFLDLAIVPYCYLDGEVFKGKLGGGCITINNNHIEMWNVDANIVLQEAKKNMIKFEPHIESVYTVIRRMNPAFCSEFDENDNSKQMYVLSGDVNHGAIYMTDVKLLKEFCDNIGSDVYVIPCSVHEVLLVPAENPEDELLLNEMVIDVNKTQLEPVDVLSDHVYYFSKNGGYEYKTAV